MATFNECSEQLEKGNTADTRQALFGRDPKPSLSTVVCEIFDSKLLSL